MMKRITITIDEPLTDLLDAYMAAHGYDNRSEAMRDLVRDSLIRHAGSGLPSDACVATLSYIFDHETRDLPKRLMRLQQGNHDLSVVSTQLPLNHESVLAVSVLRGPVNAVRRLADAVTTERGVSHASLHLVPLANSEHPPHRHDGHSHPHTHDTPLG
jgi:CopG family nickel-responsive transcriptional regulator